MKGQLMTWTYKDGHRMYWRIEAWWSGEFEVVVDDAKDWKWDYRIFREGNEYPIYEGQITGQLDYPPMLDDFLLDWQSYINSFVTGAVQHARLETGNEP